MAPDIDSPQKDDQRHDTLIFDQQSWISDSELLLTVGAL
jgi:hypothetical protein